MRESLAVHARRIHARLVRIRPDYFAQHEIEEAKVLAMVEHVRSGGTLPPCVAARYGERFMPIDGHHRFETFARLGMELDCWVVSGAAFERLDRRCRDSGEPVRAEDFVICGGTPALMVTTRHRAQPD